MSPRDRITIPVVLVYWLAVFGGLGLYTYHAPGNTMALWIGAIIGTIGGQIMAMANVRTWLVTAILACALVVCMPMVFGYEDDRAIMALIPAVLCGYWSLGDRTALVAFWFPVVLWMLSILDRTATLAPDGIGDVLLGAIVIVFVVFLRVRESRRVGLWRTVSYEPLAKSMETNISRERPGQPIARSAWTIVAAGIACAVTAWIAPRLWKLETLSGPPSAAIANLHGGDGGGNPLPCCSFDENGEAKRVSEYFDLGRGHPVDRVGVDCQVCRPDISNAWADENGVVGGDGVPGEWGYYDDGLRTGRGTIAYGAGDGYATGGYSGPADHTGGYGGTTGGNGTGGSYGNGGAYGNGGGNGNSAGTTGNGYNSGYNSGYNTYGTNAMGQTNPAQTNPNPAPTPAPIEQLGVTPPQPTPNQVTPPAHVAPTPPTPSTVTPAPQVTPPAPTPSTATAIAPAAKAPAQSHGTVAAPVAPGGGGHFWLIAILVGGVAFQLAALALRPLRRAVTLRHLRRPFWDETVDQRISNSWQLALVGLRDAGWRASSIEAPRAFAKRTGVDGLETCATIVERARHGVGLDAGDLAAMSASADVAYHSARARLGSVPRLLAWLRRPLT